MIRKHFFAGNKKVRALPLATRLPENPKKGFVYFQNGEKVLGFPEKTRNGKLKKVLIVPGGAVLDIRFDEKTGRLAACRNGKRVGGAFVPQINDQSDSRESSAKKQKIDR